MPSILLINENKIVSRLLQLSSEKNGFNLEEVSALDSSGDSYDVIFVDSDKYSDALMGEIESMLNYGQLGYIGTKQETAPSGFSLVIEKPFLPTDFVDMIKDKVIGREVPFVDEKIEALNLEDDSFDLDNIDEGVEELLINDTVEDDISLISLDEIDELDELDDVDLSLDPSLMMTTGVATAMAESENSNEELADMVSEIDLMEEDSLDSIEDDLESLVQDDVLSLEDDIVNEVEDTLVEEIQEPTPKENDVSALAVGAGVAAMGAVASQAFSEDIQEEISTLDDIDSLNEIDLQHALGEDVIEEIVSEEIVNDGEETVVESNDVEQWIRDAVAKAITPAMIKEALDGMDVNVTLSFNTKKDS